MSTEAAHPRAPDFNIRDALILVGTLGGAYGISQFLRNSIGVIAPNLATELGLSASEIGLLASVFFFSFAAAQIPLGLALDRYGPRRCMLVCAVIAIAGALLFAWAPSPGWLIAARVLMGLGASCYFMAPLALYATRFPPDRFATVAGFQYGLGTLGTLLATAPFAWAVAAIGWRACFVVVAGTMLAAGLLIAIVIRDDAPAPGAREAEPARELHRHDGGDTGALVLAALCHALHYLFELRDRGRAVGRAVSDAYLRLQPDRARQHAAGRGGVPGDRRAALGPDRPLVPQLQDPGHGRRADDRGGHGRTAPWSACFRLPACWPGSSRSGSPPAICRS